MKTYLECIPCIIRQCLNTLSLIHCSESVSTKAMREHRLRLTTSL